MRLIFVAVGHQQNIFNDENFPIYGSWDQPTAFLLAASPAPPPSSVCSMERWGDVIVKDPQKAEEISVHLASIYLNHWASVPRPSPFYLYIIVNKR